MMYINFSVYEFQAVRGFLSELPKASTHRPMTKSWYTRSDFGFRAAFFFPAAPSPAHLGGCTSLFIAQPVFDFTVTQAYWQPQFPYRWKTSLGAREAPSRRPDSDKPRLGSSSWKDLLLS